MATVAVLNLPAHGHVNPTLPVVAELVRRGERVIYYASAGFRARIEATGATFREYQFGVPFDPNGDLGGPAGLMEASMAAAESILPRLIAELREDRPDYLILDSICLWANLIQQISGLPAISSCATFPFNWESARAMRGAPGPKPPAGEMLKGLPRIVRYFWKGRRLKRRYRVRIPGMFAFFVGRQALNLVFTSREFQPCAESFGPDYRFVGPSVAPRGEPAEFPWAALGDKPLIYVSLGTVFNAALEFYKACFAAFADSPYQVIMSIGNNVDQADLGAPPANVMVRRYVPQLEVLERAALFVTHGGMNSVSESLLAGVPMVVVPQAGDQYFVAQRVAGLGLGVSVAADEADAARLRALADGVLAHPAFAARARAIGDSLRAAGGYIKAADEIAAFKQRLGIA